MCWAQCIIAYRSSHLILLWNYFIRSLLVLFHSIIIMGVLVPLLPAKVTIEGVACAISFVMI
jgi:hypothetical protein